VKRKFLPNDAVSSENLFFAVMQNKAKILVSLF